jgi:hypothetical protein
MAKWEIVKGTREQNRIAFEKTLNLKIRCTVLLKTALVHLKIKKVFEVFQAEKAHRR